MDIEKAFPLLIRELRKERGFTIKELAKNSDISERQLSNLEKGKHLPGIDTFFNLSYALGLDPPELIRKLDHKLRP